MGDPRKLISEEMVALAKERRGKRKEFLERCKEDKFNHYLALSVEEIQKLFFELTNGVLQDFDDETLDILYDAMAYKIHQCESLQECRKLFFSDLNNEKKVMQIKDKYAFCGRFPDY
jgi:predicted nuclease of restriction endonuclease-like RecB superfamily